MMKSKPENVRHAAHQVLVRSVVESKMMPGRDSMLELLDFFQRATLGNGFSEDFAKELASIFFKKFIEEFGGIYIYVPSGTHVYGDFVFKQLIDEYKKGEVSIRDIARKMGCSDTHVYRALKKMKISPSDQRLRSQRLNQQEANLERWKKENP